MAYVSANWNLLVPGVAGNPSLWVGSGTDIHTTAVGNDFISDGLAKGMRVNDIVIYFKTTATLGATIHTVGPVVTVGSMTLNSAILA